MGKPDVKSHLEDLDVDGRMSFKYIWKKWIVGRELDPWRVLLKTPMNLGFCKMQGISELPDYLLAFQGLRSVELVS